MSDRATQVGMVKVADMSHAIHLSARLKVPGLLPVLPTHIARHPDHIKLLERLDDPGACHPVINEHIIMDEYQTRAARRLTLPSFSGPLI
jgi:hypothetical protein